MQTTQVAAETDISNDWVRTSVSIRPNVLQLIDDLAREDERSRSRTISKLIESHPAIKKLAKANGNGGGG